jgi:DNA-directed RNA polymerase subunit RPC12/RpoP
MVGTQTVREDYAGVNPCWEETYICADCGGEFSLDDDYHITNGEEHYCRDCVNCWDGDRSAQFLGYQSQFDLLYDFTN